MWVPLIIAIFGLVAMGARADTRINDLARKAEDYDRLAFDRTDRLARIETEITSQGKVLDRIEQRLDKMDPR